MPKKRGRPPAPDEGRRRFNLTFRIRGDLKEQIAARAEQSGRSISEEMEFMLVDYNYKSHIIKLKDEYISRLISNSERYEAAYREMGSKVYEVDRLRSTAVSGIASMIGNVFAKALKDIEKISPRDIKNITYAVQMLHNMFPMHDLRSQPDFMNRKGYKEQTIVNLATIQRPETISNYFSCLGEYLNEEESTTNSKINYPNSFDELPDTVKSKLKAEFKEDTDELYDLFLLTKILHDGVNISE